MPNGIGIPEVRGRDPLIDNGDLSARRSIVPEMLTGTPTRPPFCVRMTR